MDRAPRSGVLCFLLQEVMLVAVEQKHKLLGIHFFTEKKHFAEAFLFEIYFGNSVWCGIMDEGKYMS